MPGSETIAHLRENKRVTIMFSAFEGPPRVTRLFATGIVHEWGTPEYVRYIPAQSRTPGSRSVIVMDVHKVSTVCNLSAPPAAIPALKIASIIWPGVRVWGPLLRVQRTAYPAYGLLHEARAARYRLRG